MRRVRKFSVDTNFKVCPACEYAEGFHLVFSVSKKSGKYRALLICPMCSTIFDIGLRCDRKVRKGSE